MMSSVPCSTSAFGASLLATPMEYTRSIGVSNGLEEPAPVHDEPGPGRREPTWLTAHCPAIQLVPERVQRAPGALGGVANSFQNELHLPQASTEAERTGVGGNTRDSFQNEFHLP